MRGVAGLRPKLEVEVVLLVTSQDPLETLERIARLDFIGNLALSKGDQMKMHDVYLDTANGDLRRRRMNLRLREADNQRFVTLKWSPGLFARNRDERRELELPWSPGSFDRVRNELEARQIRLAHPIEDAAADPVEALKNSGLEIVQDRVTLRGTKLLVSKDDSGLVLAELAIDSVTYNFGGRNIRLHEVEIEEKSRSRGSVLSECRRSLLELFGSDLRPWRWGKLATGRAIEKMLMAGILEKFLVGDRLTLKAFGVIEDFMQHKSSWRRL